MTLETPHIVMFWFVLSAAWGFLMWKLTVGSTTELRTLRRLLVVVCGVCISALFIHTDLLSDDAHRYRWDGWVASHGIDPYSAAPVDSSLAHLAHQSAGVSYPTDINNNTLKTIYPPASQIVFRSVVAVGGTSPLGFKAGWVGLCLVIVVLTLVALWSNIVLSALYLSIIASPIFLLHGFMDIHVDVLMALTVGLAVAILYKTARIHSAAHLLLGFATALKYLPVFLVQHFTTYNSTTSREVIQRAALIIVGIGAVYLPFIGSDVLGSLGVFAAAWQANSLLAWLGNNVMQPASTRLALMAIAVLGLILILLRYRSKPEWAAGLMVMLVLLCSPVVHPWYLALPLVLMLVAPMRSSIVWTITICVYGITYQMYKGNGVWYDNPIALAVEYVPVYVAFAVDIYRGPLLLGDEQRASVATSVDG
jgi:alpha-1,6-mannosyltransferase